jgi:putative hydrolase of HD superfamily
MSELDPNQVADTLIELGELALVFSLVERGTAHLDGVTPESDADHTVMLGLIGCALVHRYFPQLDAGLVAQYALVHDLVEAYAGDTHTLRSLSPEAKAAKAEREHAGFLRIAAQFGRSLPWVHEMIADYETLATPEARYVKALDKLMPKITQLLNGAVTVRAAGMSSSDLAQRHREQTADMLRYAADFPELFAVLDVLIDRLLVMLDQDAPAPV